jgi:hypothetical protein
MLFTRSFFDTFTKEYLMMAVQAETCSTLSWQNITCCQRLICDRSSFFSFICIMITTECSTKAPRNNLADVLDQFPEEPWMHLANG